ncbi:DUF5134 domain-containing protein [Saccharopolyspora shandongensis]|uniref:DUF5134 domain-containing protein n=1 Tax=Saccharopolyspora shandongensis TaxID=418495 RepID=UPI003432BCB8
MTESPLLRWILTVLFIATAVWFLLQALRRGARVPERVSSMSHVVMSALMVPMAWPWGMLLPAAPQIALFALAALWFLALAAGNARFRTGHAHGGGRAQLHHAVMMAAMVWMLATMPELMAADHGGSQPGGHHALGPGSTEVAAAGPAPAQLPTEILIITLVLGGFLILSSMGWIAAAVDSARRHPNPPNAVALCSACHGAMSIGMGAMLLSSL